MKVNLLWIDEALQLLDIKFLMAVHKLRISGNQRTVFSQLYVRSLNRDNFIAVTQEFSSKNYAELSYKIEAIYGTLN